MDRRRDVVKITASDVIALRDQPQVDVLLYDVIVDRVTRGNPVRHARLAIVDFERVDDVRGETRSLVQQFLSLRVREYFEKL